MKCKLVIRGISACVGALIVSTNTFATDMTFNYKDTDRSLKSCMHRAEDVFDAAGFLDVKRDDNGMTYWAFRDDYRAAITCYADKGMVFFIVAGPDHGMVFKYFGSIRDPF